MRTARSERARPVVVGVDGSPAAEGAVRWAAEHAAGTGAPLRLVHALPPGTGAPAWPDGLIALAGRCAGRRPGYEADTGVPADVLLARSEGARPFVLGTVLTDGRATGTWCSRGSAPGPPRRAHRSTG